MLKKLGVQYLVMTNDISHIYEKMKDMQPKCLMSNMLIKRVVCKLPNKKNAWLRILEGDIEYIGDTQRCTMSYVTENVDNNEKDTLILRVDNFEDAIHFAKKMGYNEISYQENLRSKFVCEYDRARFVIRFDVWAGIPRFTVIEIALLSGENNFYNIEQKLKIQDYVGVIHDNHFKKISEIKDNEQKLNKESFVSIEDLYESHTGKIASMISNITFELGLWSNNMEKEINVNTLN